VIILSEKSKKALAVVSDSLLSLAIGKQGLNVRLANKLTDWMIDVKTDAQFAEMDIAAESKRAVKELFGEGETEEFSRISELPGVDSAVAQALLDNGIDYIVDFIDLSKEQLDAMENISDDQIAVLRSLIDESVEIQEEETEDSTETEFTGDESGDVSDYKDDQGGEETEEIECPKCFKKFVLDMDGFSGDTVNCPNCGAELELSFEEEEGD
jgi:N utilization substance protein A